MPDGTPIVDELEKYREEQKKMQELENQKLIEKEIKKGKKREKSTTR